MNLIVEHVASYIRLKNYSGPGSSDQFAHTRERVILKFFVVGEDVHRNEVNQSRQNKKIENFDKLYNIGLLEPTIA